jgi:RNA polymerase sigma factor (sigma-70 family)
VSEPVADLVRRARHPRVSIGEQHRAFSDLVERFEPMAYATALSSCDDPEHARDACQEAFLLAWRTLPRLREPEAFGGWLKRLIRTQCRRTRVRKDTSALIQEERRPAGDDIAQRRIRDAVRRLPADERHAITMFYFLGESLRSIGRALDVSEAAAGKLLYSARLRVRRGLPPDLAQEFQRRRPTSAFSRAVRAGIFDDLAGEYRFATRPDHPVVIRREGDALVSYAAGQRNVLASRKADALVTTEFDGEGRFGRDRHGRVTHFAYYEFGRRLGVARRITTSSRPRSRRTPGGRSRGPSSRRRSP